MLLRDQRQAQALFGARDDFLRRACRVTGATVVLRGNELRFSGPAAAAEDCAELIRTWKAILEDRGELTDDDVRRTLDQVGERESVPMPSTRFSEAPAGEVRERPSRRRVGTDRPVIPATELTEPRSVEGRDKVGRIRPRTEGQERYFSAMLENELVFCDGPAGCGKTYLAVARGLEALRHEEVRKIVLVRPAVEAGEKLGFLPGDLLAKVNPFLRPLLDAVNDMLDFEAVRRYMSNDIIEVVPLAFMRGRTLNQTFMILDEAQNTTITQMKMFLTRMGVGSRIVVTGDATQNDLPKGTPSGLRDGIRRLGQVQGVSVVRMGGKDIVRHRLVRDIVSAYEKEGPGSKPAPPS